MKAIRIETNRPQYFNDIAEEIRLFTGLSDVYLNDDSAECAVELTVAVEAENRNAAFWAIAAANDKMYRYMVPCDENATDLIKKKLEKRAIKVAVFRLMRQLFDIETPWGSLTGIRPTKLYRDLTNDGFDAEQFFRETYDVSMQKAELAKQICNVQKSVIRSVQPKDIDIYIGIPFCKTRCLYCSFASELVGKGDLLSKYLDILKEDIRSGGELVRMGGFHVRSIYFGGGTPTVLDCDQMRDILEFTAATYGKLDSLECTVEAGRPDTITREKLMCMKTFGVKRISVNPQTMNDATLQRVGRTHSVADTIRIFHMAKEIEFESINMDLIAGLPGETIEDFQHSLAEVQKLAPDNLTVHSLAIKRSSLLKAHMDEYEMAPAQDVETMIEMGRQAAQDLGLNPYYMYRQKYMSGNLENVGYAKPGRICIYNVDMMEETTSILAHGAGAMIKRVFHAESRIERIPNPKDVPTYAEKLPLLIEQRKRMFLQD